jgi:hypothetical protein
MAKLLRTKLAFFLFLFFSWATLFSTPSASTDTFEKVLEKAISKEIKYSGIKIKIWKDAKNDSKIENLVVRLENVNVSGIKVDFITLQYTTPKIDTQLLQKYGSLKIISYSNQKVSMLISTENLQNYLSIRAKEFGKNNINIKLKYTPPFIECFYNVPKSEIASATIDLLSKFIPGDKLEGYAAFTLTSKKNELSAHSSKVILNHFLIPTSILYIFEKKFNPFDNILPLNIFKYEINNIAVQSKYVLLTN